MSCSLCRLPFVPGPGAAAPHPKAEPPPGLLTVVQHQYFDHGVGIGRHIMGAVTKLDSFGGNMFGNCNLVVFTAVWETNGTTFMMFHTACAALLRRVLETDDDDSEEHAIKLCSLELALGRPQGGEDAGRFMYVNYESVGWDKVDLRPFWREGSDPGENTFEWHALKDQGLDWVLSKPDIFPRFFPKVTEARLSLAKVPEGTRTDILTTQPFDILHAILNVIPLISYLALTSTCRFFRFHALTTFQPRARNLVLRLRWAVPLPAEYAKLKARAVDLAHSENSPHDGDWLLYLNHVNRTKSMKVRRWLWALSEEVKRTYEERKGDGFGEEIVKLEREVKQMYMMTKISRMQQTMREMGMKK